MTYRLRPYPNYRPSRADWLMEVPEYWQEERLGALFGQRNEKVSDRDYQPLSVTRQGIVPQIETAAKTNAGDNRKLVRVEDFVINSRSDRKGSSGVSDRDGSVSLISIVLTPRGIAPRFAHHLLRSIPFQEEFYRYGKGIVADLWSTNYSEMKNIILPVPSRDEQSTIAAFLDQETARIDRLIEKQQRLIELLKEKRQAVISHAVNTRSRRKAKISYCAELLPGYAFPSSEFSTHPSDVRLLRGVNVGLGSTKWDDVAYWPENRVPEVADFMLRKGDIVIGMDRPWIAGGTRVAMIMDSDLPALLLQRVCRIRARDGVAFQSYLELALASDEFRSYVESDLTGVSVPHLSAEQIGGFKLALPPVEEQEEIVADANRKLSAISATVDKAESFIDLANERRSALVSAAVTGKIDVRDWQPPEQEDAAA